MLANVVSEMRIKCSLVTLLFMSGGDGAALNMVGGWFVEKCRRLRDNHGEDRVDSIWDVLLDSSLRHTLERHIAANVTVTLTTGEGQSHRILVHL